MLEKFEGAIKKSRIDNPPETPATPISQYIVQSSINKQKGQCLSAYSLWQNEKQKNRTLSKQFQNRAKIVKRRKIDIFNKKSRIDNPPETPATPISQYIVQRQIKETKTKHIRKNTKTKNTTEHKK
jgi:hypothetical protein